jgi:biopolymer transport protein TolR
MRNRRRRRELKIPEVSLTPLIDTALTLLIIFMVTTPMLQDSIKVKLPEVKSKSDKASEFCLTVYIDSKSNVHVNDKIIGLDKLKPVIEKGLKSSECKIISLKGDKDIPYGKLMAVMDIINSAEGEKYVSLGTTFKS